MAPVSGDKDTLAVRAALTLLRGYKLAFSPLFRGSCRFLPSCADYAAIAIARHGVLYGTWLAARRLARCHPLCAGGHDPVPLDSFPQERCRASLGAEARSAKAAAVRYGSAKALRHNL